MGCSARLCSWVSGMMISRDTPACTWSAEDEEVKLRLERSNFTVEC